MSILSRLKGRRSGFHKSGIEFHPKLPPWKGAVCPEAVQKKLRKMFDMQRSPNNIASSSLREKTSFHFYE
jgi:hypothetical protein